ncbi:hypothetical protein IW140_003019 [Coemansia sp. RSA 1813]|nr:hypothetical protein LPJ74_005640 [Coemansia sp. RSA 1843]KAJ2569465.1 hypothetical protein IW140_003019 [Coemansia sp. RSA 1813]
MRSKNPSEWKLESARRNSAEVRGKQSLSESRNIADQIGRDFRNLIGYRLAQVWICGPIVLTFHASPSAAIKQAMQELVAKSMKHMEDRFNHRYNYPYVFLNDKPFSEEFINMTRSMTNAEVHYGQIPQEHWSYPEWIDQKKAKEDCERMDKDGVMYGGSESYHHMCRFESGLFFKHPLMQQFDYYWRLGPRAQYLCDISHDPFLYMKERKIRYG